mmetsp:Transcript_20906/g.35951  ORF Transcript_20906/g.35951 Transcript_20906/m.35951 type:complete len:496 (-) Transcript_20906:84-1571(-)|eukprot:CAMPEP_0183728880 /NCGR_PEP_ID=MMETSP0737-20130205/29156_1 /TAXON_ID=385413 /ORGANISM="Thalassiosira miniscula, Strain CCMP1093" /LENGTH=495 /DNA_ID=CAMNT_0025960937 /DNA_START=52 /DNA_END=1539 /DNA_ORIENTATION=+
MTPSSARNAVLPLLVSLGAAAVIAEQQPLLVPPPLPFSSLHSSSSFSVSPRQRHLEPWRQQIREQCHEEVARHCARSEDNDGRRVLDTDELRPLYQPSSYLTWMSTFSSLGKEMDSYFTHFMEQYFEGQSSEDVSASESSEDGNEDQIASYLMKMMGFSLQAFDQKTLSDHESYSLDEEVEDSDASDVSEDTESYLPYRNEDYVLDEHENADYYEDYFSDDMRSRLNEEVAVLRIPRPSPEQVAEGALDAMVAALVRSVSVFRANDAKAESTDVEEKGEKESYLQRRLSEFGNEVLTETAAARRRLTESDAIDPRLQVKERLARRLTEYSTDVFYSPDGTKMTLYRGSVGHSTSSGRGQLVRSSLPQASLGVASNHVDECLRSKYDNGELERRCHRAIGEFLLLVSVSDEVNPPSLLRKFRRTVRRLPKAVQWVVAAVIWFAVYCTLDLFCICVPKEEEERDAGAGDASLLDYTLLTGDDTQEEHVLVGQLVQVV